ncbi:MAG: hypothetical protein Q7S80_00290 [bacterium]|nr:hypothetical protein [bacterium]
MKKPDWIDPFLRSSYQLFTNHDPASHLPFDAWGLLPHYSDLWLEKIYEMILAFENKDLKIEDCLELFPNLSSTRFIILMDMIHYHLSKVENPEMVTTIQTFFVKSLKLRSKEDLFAYDKNIEYADDEVRKKLENHQLKPASQEESREIGKILVALASLTHGLYNDWCTDFDYEITGPYKIDDEMILLRSFPDLNPKDIWPKIVWDFKDVSIITTYKNIDAKIAFVGCHITYTDNTVNNLTRYNVEVDGKKLDNLDKLRDFREKVMPIAAEQFEKYLGMNFEDQKIKFVFQEHYQLKKLFDLVEMDWRPDRKLLDRIKDKALIEDVFPSYEMTLKHYSGSFGGDKLIEAYSRV